MKAHTHTRKSKYVLKVRTEGRARFGPLPKRGQPAHTLLACKVTIAEHTAVKEAMRIDGSPTYSEWIVKAIHARLEQLNIPVVITGPNQGKLV